MRYLVLLALLIAPVASAQTWSAVPPPTDVPSALQIVGTDADSVLLVTQGVAGWQLYRSTDGATSWGLVDIALASSLSRLGDRQWAAVDRGTGRETQHLLLSSDDGANWTRRNLQGIGAVRPGDVDCLASLGPDSLLVGVRVSGGSRGSGLDLYVGARSGGAWKSLGFPRKGWESGCATDPQGAIFGAVNRTRQIERSRNRGSSWDTLTVQAEGLTGLLGSVYTLGADTLFAATPSTLLRSIDAGTSWSRVQDIEVPPFGTLSGFTVQPGGRLLSWSEPSYGAIDAKVSSDRGATWQDVGLSSDLRFRDGLFPASVSALFSPAEGDFIVGTSAEPGVVCVAKTAGQTEYVWSEYQNNFGLLYRGTPSDLARVANAPVGFNGFTALSTLSGMRGPLVGAFRSGLQWGGVGCLFEWSSRQNPSSPTTPLLAAVDISGQGVILSDSMGVSVLSPSPTFEGADADLSTWRDIDRAGDRYLAVSDARVWQSGDGAGWTLLVDLPGDVEPTSVLHTSGGAIVGSADGRILRYDGISWTTPYDGGDIGRIRGLHLSVGRRTAFGKNGVLLSTDDGATWSTLGEGLGGEDVFSFLPLSPERFLAGTATGVWELTDPNGQWTAVNDGIESHSDPIIGLQLMGTTSFQCEFDCPISYSIIAYTEQQAYVGYSLGSEFTSASPEAAAALTLGAPSPTPSASGVRFDLSTPSRATLAVYDLLGRRVWQADVQPGVRSAEWDGQGVGGGRAGAGVYLIVLRSDGGMRTTRAVLL